MKTCKISKNEYSFECKQKSYQIILYNKLIILIFLGNKRHEVIMQSGFFIARLIIVETW